MEAVILTVIPKGHYCFYFQVIVVISYTSVLVYAARSNIRLRNKLCFPSEKQNETKQNTLLSLSPYLGDNRLGVTCLSKE